MLTPGKGQLLLSMLGVALSHTARLYLKKTDQGLKHFLAQYPQEFGVDGAKGRECVSYFPALQHGGTNNSDLPLNFQTPAQNPIPVGVQAHARRNDTLQGASTPAARLLDPARQQTPARHQTPQPRQNDDEAPQSPKVSSTQPRHDLPETPFNQHGATPSIWGTPGTPTKREAEEQARLKGGPMAGPPGAGRPGQGFMPGQELFTMGWQMPTQTLWPGPTFWPPHATPWTQAAQAEASQAAATAAAALYSRGEGGATGPAPGIAGGPGSAPPHLFPGPTLSLIHI